MADSRKESGADVAGLFTSPRHTVGLHRWGQSHTPQKVKAGRHPEVGTDCPLVDKGSYSRPTRQLFVSTVRLNVKDVHQKSDWFLEAGLLVVSCPALDSALAGFSLFDF